MKCTMTRHLVPTLLLGSTALLSGCLYGGAAAIGVASSGGGGGGGAAERPNTAPEVEIDLAAFEAQGRPIGTVQLPLTLRDAEVDPVELVVEVLQNGRKLFDATDAGPGAGSIGKEDIAVTAEGVRRVFVWDSAADFGDQDTHRELQLRVLPKDGRTTGEAKVSSVFQINNAAPTVTLLSSPPTEVTGNLVVRVELADVDIEPCRLALRVSGDNGASWLDVPESAVVAGSVSELTATPAGIEVSLAVNLADAALFQALNAEQALLEITPVDGLTSGSPVLAGPFRVRNNAPPTLNLEPNVDDTREVALAMGLSDPESDDMGSMRGIMLNPDGETGELRIGDFPALSAAAPLRPGTVLLRYDGGRVLRDVPTGDGRGRLVALNGPAPTADAFITYSTGAFSGDGAIIVEGELTPFVTADVNTDFLVVKAFDFRDFRETAGDFKPCTAVISSQQVPFPAFVTDQPQRLSLLWDSLRDVGTGNSIFVQLRVTVDDGSNEVRREGNRFFVNNGPLGFETQVATGGQSDDAALGDVDNDGRTDIVVANSAEGSLSVFIGNGIGFRQPFIIPLPPPQTVPGDPSTNLIASRELVTLPNGSLRPAKVALLDVNRDGNLDAVVASSTRGLGGEPFPEYFRNFFIFFGNGDGTFQTTTPWGPFPILGRDVKQLEVRRLNDDNGDGLVDEQDTPDLAVLSSFTHDPAVTRTLEGIAGQRILPGAEAIPAAAAGNSYDLTAVRLQQTPILPGSVLFDFGAAGTVVDRDSGEGFGLLEDTVSGRFVASLDYATGRISRRSPSGASFPGRTTFPSAGSVTLAYGRRIQAADRLVELPFLTHPLRTGETRIEVRGMGSRGQTLTTDDQHPVYVRRPLSLSIPVGRGPGAVETVGELLERLRTALDGEVVNAVTDRMEAGIDEAGRLVFRVVGRAPGARPVINAPVALRITDTSGNVWPGFENPFGVVTLYHTRPEGGFHSPRCSRDLANPLNPREPLFPAWFPATAGDVPALLPEQVRPDGTAGRAGPGTVTQFLRFHEAAPDRVIFPYGFSTASSPSGNLVADPRQVPEFGGTGTVIGGTDPRWLGGVVGNALVADKVVGTGTNLENDERIDFVIGSRADMEMGVFAELDFAGLVGLDPSLQTIQATHPWLQGLYVMRATELLRGSIAGLRGQVLAGLLTINDEVIPVTGDYDNDGVVDFVVVFGNFLLVALNRATSGTQRDLFEVRLGLAAFGGRRPALADFNSDGRLDIALPSVAQSAVLTLIQEPPGEERIKAGPANSVVLSGRTLRSFTPGTEIIVPGSLRITFTSGGAPAVLVGGPTRELALTLAVGTPGETELGVVGGYSPLSGELFGQIPVPVDGELSVRYDRIFQENFLGNLGLANLKATVFGTGMNPILAEPLDLNSDRRPDLVALNEGSNSLSFRVQVRESPLDTFFPVAAGEEPVSIVRANLLGGNGTDEIVVANGGSGTLSIYRPDPDVGLVRLQDVGLPILDTSEPDLVSRRVAFPNGPGAMVARDIDGDGLDDLLVPCASVIGGAGSAARYSELPTGVSGGFALLPGVSNGVLLTTTVGVAFEGVTSGGLIDMDGDGRLDVALTSPRTTTSDQGYLSVYRNRGGAHPVLYGPRFGNESRSNDPFVEAHTALPYDAGIGALLTAMPDPGTIVTVDLDGDGFKELVVGTAQNVKIGPPSLLVVRGVNPSLNGGVPFERDPASGFGLGFKFTPLDVSSVVSISALDVVVADFDQDGRPDLVVADSVGQARAGVLLNRSTPGQITFEPIELSLLGQPAAPAVGDLDSDGLPDVAIPLKGESLVAIFLNDPLQPGRFQSPVFQETGPVCVSALITDVDGNGKNDLLLTSKGSSTINVLLQR